MIFLQHWRFTFDEILRSRKNLTVKKYPPSKSPNNVYVKIFVKNESFERHIVSCRITAKVPMGKGKEASTPNDQDAHEQNDNDKKTS